VIRDQVLVEQLEIHAPALSRSLEPVGNGRVQRLRQERLLGPAVRGLTRQPPQPVAHRLLVDAELARNLPVRAPALVQDLDRHHFLLA